MALPQLRPDGTLPPGTYPATLGEIATAFNQQGSTMRPALNAALQHAASLIWSRDATAILCVDGSYITDKRDPLDVDMAVRSNVWDDTQFVAAFAATYPTEAFLIDVYFNPKQSAQHMEDLFREIQGSSTRKGIIQALP